MAPPAEVAAEKRIPPEDTSGNEDGDLEPEVLCPGHGATIYFQSPSPRLQRTPGDVRHSFTAIFGFASTLRTAGVREKIRCGPKTNDAH